MSFIPQTVEHSSPLEAACGNNHLQVAQLLIINGADVDYQNSVCNNIIIVFIVFKMVLSQNGVTPLHRAAGNGNVELVKLLLLSHAKVNTKDSVSTNSIIIIVIKLVS